MPAIPEASLTLSEARELVAALVGAVAQERDIPLLAIKGATLAAHGLREHHESADVDVLISPIDVDSFIDLLQDRGWRRHADDTTAHVMPEHSVTLVHRRWPLELDVHSRFPGFLADPQVVFDALWTRRTRFEQAHHDVVMPDRLGSILIAALNYERAPDFGAVALADLRGVVAGTLEQEERRELADLATRSGCADTLREFLESIDVPTVGVGSSDHEALAAWNLYRSGGHLTAVAWLEELRRASWSRRPALLWHAVMFTEDELRIRFPQAPRGSRGVWLARYWRLREALRALPRAVRVMREQRRAS
jgi:hypothetical protein